MATSPQLNAFLVLDVMSCRSRIVSSAKKLPLPQGAQRPRAAGASGGSRSERCGGDIAKSNRAR